MHPQEGTGKLTISGDPLLPPTHPGRARGCTAGGGALATNPREALLTCLPLLSRSECRLPWLSVGRTQPLSFVHAGHALGRAAPPGSLLRLTFPPEVRQEKAYVHARGWVHRARLQGLGIARPLSSVNATAPAPAATAKVHRLQRPGFIANSGLRAVDNILDTGCDPGRRRGWGSRGVEAYPRLKGRGSRGRLGPKRWVGREPAPKF